MVARVVKGPNIETGQYKEWEGGWHGVDNEAGLGALGRTAED